jgi:thioredoxin 1
MTYSTGLRWSVLAVAASVVAVGVLAGRRVLDRVDPKSPECQPLLQSATSLGEQNMSVSQIKSQVHDADETTFANLVLNSRVPVLVDFYADWCGPCQRLAPILEQLAAETPDDRIVKINVDNSPSLAAEYGISSIPSLKVFENGEVRKELVGLASKSQLRAMLGR